MKKESDTNAYTFRVKEVKYADGRIKYIPEAKPTYLIKTKHRTRMCSAQITNDGWHDISDGEEHIKNGYTSQFEARERIKRIIEHIAEDKLHTTVVETNYIPFEV